MRESTWMGFLALSLALNLCGCSSAPGSDGVGGSGGEAGGGHIGGASGVGGSGGDAGLGGGDGNSNFQEPISQAQALCLAWCEDETSGDACCDGDCSAECFRWCSGEGTFTCVEEFSAMRDCEMDLACSERTEPCDDETSAFDLCVLQRFAAQQCPTVAAACEVEEAGCLSAIEATDTECAGGWVQYAICIGTAPRTCAECSAFTLDPLAQCDFPSGADQENFGENPPACLDFPSVPIGCGRRCPGGTDFQCSPSTHCSDGRCDAECVVEDECGEEEQCVRGRCEAAPLQCGDQNVLNPEHPASEGALVCGVFGVSVLIDVALTASPVAPVAVGGNEYDLQIRFTVDASTVDFLVNFTDVGDVSEFSGSVVATEGNAAMASQELALSPTPCALFFIAGTEAQATTAPVTHSWTLDQGTGQELSLEDVTIRVSGAGVALNLSTVGTNSSCAWRDGQPPTLRFMVQ